MIWIDLVLLGILVWAAIRGYMKGLIVQLATLLALVAGIFGAIRFSDYTANLLIEKLNFTTSYLHLISFALTFAVIVIAVHLVAKVVEKIISSIALGFANRLAGAFFSAVKMLLIASIVLLLVNTVNEKFNFLSQEDIKDSKLYGPVAKVAPFLFPYVKSNFLEIKERHENDTLVSFSE